MREDKSTYEFNFGKLKHSEVPAAMDKETGEIRELKRGSKKGPSANPNLTPFEPDAQFTRTYTKVWKHLLNELTPLEYKVAHSMSVRAKAFNNSLEPLSEDLTIRELAAELGISIGKVNVTTKRLFELGVYGRFKVYKGQDKEYWVLSPYLSFNGSVVDRGLVELFNGTTLEQVFHGTYTV